VEAAAKGKGGGGTRGRKKNQERRKEGGGKVNNSGSKTMDDPKRNGKGNRVSQTIGREENGGGEGAMCGDTRPKKKKRKHGDD